MNSKIFWNECILLYDLLVEQKCLCMYKTDPKTILDFLKTSSDKSYVSDKKGDSQLLNINVLRLLAETYAAESNKYQKVCKEVQSFFKILCEEDIFYYMVDKYLITLDQHLSWSYAKTLSAIFHGSKKCVTKEWIHFIAKELILQSPDDKCLNLLELLSFLVGSGLKVSHDDKEDDKCENKITCILPSPNDHYSFICDELAPYWSKMMELYSNTGSYEVAFLNLWRMIINGTLQDDLLDIYLNKKYILDILLHGKLNRPKVAFLYLEIIIKIFCSSLRFRPWTRVDHILIEKSVITALSDGLLESVPIHEMEFCMPIKETSSPGFLNLSNENEENFGVIGKNIIFILMNLLSEFQDMKLLNESYQKIITFISKKNMLAPLWLVNIFLDDDDLLFGIMLASLRIYQNLQNDNSIRTEQSAIELFLLHDINPHALFLKLLQFIGYDHNELLSFLVSDETCCLLYLTEYLKLLLKEKDKFIETYTMLIYDEEYNPTNSTNEKKSAVEQNKLHSEQIQSDSVNIIVDGAGISPKVTFKNSHLVTYSSSSSETESSDDEKDDVENLLKVVLTLKNLKDNIQKLVDINEFPYTITPLLILLKSCDDLFR